MAFAKVAAQFGLPLFLHFAEGAGGSGNYIVRSEAEFDAVKVARPGQRLNVKKYLVGRSCTMDVCVTRGSVLVGPVEEMVIGAPPLNSNPTEYVASSWFENGYYRDVRERFHRIGTALGELVRKRGFLGMFNPDFLVQDGKIFLTELNMRFGGSCGVYAKLERHLGRVSMMLVHALTFLDPDLEFDAEAINRLTLAPANYALMMLKNYSGRPVRIAQRYRSGIFDTSGARVTETGRRGLDQLNTRDEVLLVGLPDSGAESTTIDEGALICEVVSRFPISDGSSNLTDEGRILADRLLNDLTSA